MQNADVQPARGLALFGHKFFHNRRVFQNQQRVVHSVPVFIHEYERLLPGIIHIFHARLNLAFVRKRLDLKVFPAAFKYLFGGKALNAAHKAVRREHHKPRMCHIDERHHDEFAARRPNGIFTAVIAVMNCGFIAVMPVRNVQFARRKIGAERFKRLLVIHNPQAVCDKFV